jgi:hypothetical protein
MTVTAVSAQALEYGEAPWLACLNNKEAAEVGARNTPLEPANDATVSAGTPVIFSAESLLHNAPTFNVASSEPLLSSPDIDSGPGSQSGSFYRFTSSKATATPRTIYWTASFTFTPGECEAPSTFTTPVHTLIVAPASATFTGPGNLTQPAPAAVTPAKPKPKPAAKKKAAKCPKGKKREHGKCVRKLRPKAKKASN